MSSGGNRGEVECFLFLERAEQKYIEKPRFGFPLHCRQVLKTTTTAKGLR